jgi:hypothetical protein
MGFACAGIEGGKPPGPFSRSRDTTVTDRVISVLELVRGRRAEVGEIVARGEQ